MLVNFDPCTSRFEAPPVPQLCAMTTTLSCCCSGSLGYTITRLAKPMINAAVVVPVDLNTIRWSKQYQPLTIDNHEPSVTIVNPWFLTTSHSCSPGAWLQPRGLGPGSHQRRQCARVRRVGALCGEAAAAEQAAPKRRWGDGGEGDEIGWLQLVG